MTAAALSWLPSLHVVTHEQADPISRTVVGNAEVITAGHADPQVTLSRLIGSDFSTWHRFWTDALLGKSSPL
jgi:hypothetical protein